MVYTDARSKPKSAAVKFWWPLRSSRCFLIAEAPVQDLGCSVAVKYVILRKPACRDFSKLLFSMLKMVCLSRNSCRLHSVMHYRLRRELGKCG